jgi:hypothetical protein
MADDDKPSWNVLLLIGTIAGVAFGALLVLLFRDRRQMPQSQLQGGGGGSPITIYNGYGPNNDYAPSTLAPTGYPALPEAPAYQTKDNVMLASRANTFTLSPTRSIRVFTAPRSGPTWRVQIRVIGPAGGFGQFSIDQPLSDEVNTNLTMGSPQAIIVPSNGWSEVRLGPRQILYAKAAGTEPDVQASIVASAEV